MSARTPRCCLGAMNGCTTDRISVRLLYARNEKWSVSGSGEEVDLEARRRAIDAEQKVAAAEEAARAEAQRIAADKEAEREKRLAAQRKRQDAEAKARYAKQKAEEEAAAAEKLARLRAACAGVYKKTVDKKIKDLTVGEEQQVRACQAAGLYPPL